MCLIFVCIFPVKLKSTDIRFANNLLDAVRIDVYQGDLEPVTIPDMFLTVVKQWKQKTALGIAHFFLQLFT